MEVGAPITDCIRYEYPADNRPLLTGVSSFGAIIVKGFGFDTLQTTLVGMATGGSEFVGIVACIFISRHTNTRVIPAVVATGIAVIGGKLRCTITISYHAILNVYSSPAILMIAPPEHQRNLRYGGYCLMFWWPVAIIFLLSWLASMIAGHTKKIVFLATYQLFYAGEQGFISMYAGIDATNPWFFSAGNITGTQIFNNRDAPAYTPAKVGMLIGLCFQATFFVGIFAIHYLWNKKRDQRLQASGLDREDEPDEWAFANKTDQEQQRFRFPY